MATQAPLVRMLPIDVTEQYVGREPIPRLRLSCDITNPTDSNICILDAWVEVEAANGLKVDEGKLFKGMYAHAYPATIPAHEKGSGAFIIELSPKVLYSIEERRAGGDLELRITSRVLVAKVSNTSSESSHLEVPYETSFGNGLEGQVKYQIPQSEWVDLLKKLGWSEVEFIELPTRILAANPALARALEYFGKAQDCFHRSQWHETMFNCRMAFEAAAKESGQTDDMAKGSKALIDTSVSDPKKAEQLGKVIKEFGQFLHLGRHEDFPSVAIKRIDAQLALQLTGSLLAYLGYAIHD